MENEIGINDFNELLKNIEYSKSSLSYSTNTININLKNKNGNNCFFVIDPQWRIILNNEMIINSYNYPYHENYTEEELEKEKYDFYKWCHKTNFMKNEMIIEIKILDTYDLIIKWKNGAVLNKFVADIKNAEYYFYDKINDKVYDIIYGKIIQNDFKNNGVRPNFA